jgi:hypothetical protein
VRANLLGFSPEASRAAINIVGKAHMTVKDPGGALIASIQF